MTQDIENIKAKIRKLLALAADPSAVGSEAETAGRQAAKLMAKFELDEYECAGGKAAIHDFDLTTGEAMGARPGKKGAQEVPLWISLIAVGVCRYTNTRMFRGAGTLKFGGRRSDVELATWLHNTLATRCYEQGKAHCAGQGQSAANAFRNGFAGQIQSRLYAMAAERKEAEQELGTSGTALVLVRAELSTAMIKEYGEPPQMKKVSCRQSSLGREAGSSAHIPTARPICSSSSSSQLR